MFSPLNDPATVYCQTSSQVISGSQQRSDTILTSFSISASISPLYSLFYPLLPLLPLLPERIFLPPFSLKHSLSCLDRFPAPVFISSSLSFHPSFMKMTSDEHSVVLYSLLVSSTQGLLFVQNQGLSDVCSLNTNVFLIHRAVKKNPGSSTSIVRL